MEKTLKILSSKKALSSVTVVLILMVIGVAAILSTYAWTTSLTDKPQANDVTPYKEDVKFEAGDKITLCIGNSGKADTQILQVKVGTCAGDAACFASLPEMPIALGGDATVNFTVCYSWHAGQTYYFNVVAANGQQPLLFQEQAPE
jgi:hypothetical protein